VITRFAPAPTGFLHLGHVLNAIHVWGLARSRGGRVLLRIEDHDRQRSRPEFERAILDDLDWLGFVPDEPSTDAFRAGPCRGRQRDRHDIYETALSRLRDMGLVYACECSRKDMNAAGETATGDELRYPGTCASKNLQERPGLGLRVRLEPSIERFTDLRHGPQEQSPAEQCGDLLVRDREGNWTYQFAVAVDDFDQDVDFVVRGDDLLASTGRQLQLARLLGRASPPQFVHHALIMKTAGQKLSKSDGHSGVRDLRTKGWTAADVIGEAAFLGGLLGERRPVPPQEAAELHAEVPKA
jgi:glutamyl-tRNA synthetase/glutamyl-Q tRNA(Asp) synthetase